MHMMITIFIPNPSNMIIFFYIFPFNHIYTRRAGLIPRLTFMPDCDLSHASDPTHIFCVPILPFFPPLVVSLLLGSPAEIWSVFNRGDNELWERISRMTSTTLPNRLRIGPKLLS